MQRRDPSEFTRPSFPSWWWLAAILLGPTFAVTAQVAAVREQISGRIRAQKDSRGWRVVACGMYGDLVEVDASATGAFRIDVPTGEVWTLWAYQTRDEGRYACTAASWPSRPGKSITLFEPAGTMGETRLKLHGVDAWGDRTLEAVLTAKFPTHTTFVRVPVDGDQVCLPFLPAANCEVTIASRGGPCLQSSRFDTELGGESRTIDYEMPARSEQVIHFEANGTALANVNVSSHSMRAASMPSDPHYARSIGTTDEAGRIVLDSVGLDARFGFFVDAPGYRLQRFPRRTLLRSGQPIRVVDVGKPRPLQTITCVGAKGSFVDYEVGSSMARLPWPEQDRDGGESLLIDGDVCVWGRYANHVLAAHGDREPLAQYALLYSRKQPDWAVVHCEELVPVLVRVVDPSHGYASCARISVRVGKFVRTFTASVRGTITVRMHPGAECKLWAEWQGGASLIHDVVVRRPLEGPLHVRLAAVPVAVVEGAVTGPTNDPIAGVQVFFGAIDESSPGLNLTRRRSLLQIAFTDESGRFRVDIPQAHWGWNVDMRVRLEGRTVHWETSGALRELRENVKRVRLDVGPAQRTPTDTDR